MLASHCSGTSGRVWCRSRWDRSTTSSPAAPMERWRWGSFPTASALWTTTTATSRTTSNSSFRWENVAFRLFSRRMWSALSDGAKLPPLLWRMASHLIGRMAAIASLWANDAVTEQWSELWGTSLMMKRVKAWQSQSMALSVTIQSKRSAAICFFFLMKCEPKYGFKGNQAQEIQQEF